MSLPLIPAPPPFLTKMACLLGLLFVMVWLGGCVGRHWQDPPLPDPQLTASPPAPAGSLYQRQGSLMLFTDQRARSVGDILTVRLEESTSARKSASTNTAKNQSVSVGVPSFFGQVTEPLELSAEFGGERAFTGSGDSAQSNQLSGQVTVQIVEMLPGGTMRVAGEKRLRLNQGVEVVRLTGLVRESDIAPDNTIPSFRIANADISYSGRGAVADANTQGWVARFFSSPLWPL